MEKKENYRIVIIGDIEKSDEKQTKLGYEAVGGQRICYIPRQAMISTTKTSDGKTAFLIQSCDLQHGRYDVLQQFADLRAPYIIDAEHIETVEILEYGGGDDVSEVLKKQIQPPTGDLFSIANTNNDICADGEED